MAIVFPINPSVNDTFTVGSITYKWDGAKWIGLGVTPTDRLIEGSNSLEINASNELVWTGGTTERLRITSAGSLQVKGDTNPNAVFDRGSANTTNVNFNYNGTLTGQLGAANTEFQISAVGAATPLVAYVGGQEALRINSSRQLITKGRIFINNTNGGFDYNTTADTLEVLTTNGGTHSEFNSGAFVPSGSKNLGSNGARWNTIYGNTINLATGIDFSTLSNAAGMTSEVLDDYEEGTWTPSLISGYTSPSYGTQEGTYTKIGRLVYIRGIIRPSNGTSTTGSGVQIGGLPYSAGSTGQITVSLSGVNSSANHRSIYGEISGNSQVDLYYRGDSAIFTASGNSIGANLLTFIRFSGTYSTS